MIDLVAGANMPLPGGQLVVSLAGPFDLSALVTGVDGRVSGDGDFVFFNQPTAPGVRLDAGVVHVDPARLRSRAERVVLVASPEDTITPFGRLPAPALTVRGRDGRTLARFRPDRLGSETVLQLVEIYRRDGGWKLRALGQGYATGLDGLARDFGVEVEDHPRPDRPSPDGDVVAMVVAGTNAERAAAGLAPLTVEARLTAAALAHGTDMAARDFFAHESPEGRSVADRVTAAGYAYRIVAENIAAGQRDAAEVVTGWMNSPGHRANILNPELRQIGVGRAAGGTYGTYWVQVFGTPR
jgi:stress response protein SCP2